MWGHRLKDICDILSFGDYMDWEDTGAGSQEGL